MDWGIALLFFIDGNLVIRMILPPLSSMAADRCSSFQSLKLSPLRLAMASPWGVAEVIAYEEPHVRLMK